jgi:hypothetical protein
VDDLSNKSGHGQDQVHISKYYLLGAEGIMTSISKIDKGNYFSWVFPG